MKPEDKELIKYRFSRTEESLEEAKILLNSGHYNATVNRLYYACFYIVTALLLSEGMSSSKHSGVKSLFFRHWVNMKRVSKDLGKYYQKLFDYRQKVDYSDLIYFEKEQVELLLQEATAFVSILKSKLLHQLG
ncbi:MAG: HEPN domain-containing protein [Peptococcaceae bacterium]|nr:HEPN domain-containing protein [Peptococcaceae bacterium]